MEIFHRYGLWGGMRIAHVMFAVMWMGLLWFFNFVQTPAYAQLTDAGADKLREASCGHEGSIRSLMEEHLSAREIDQLSNVLAKVPGGSEE